MFEVVTITLLATGAVLLNAHAARTANRSSDRRARLEERWSALILGERLS